MTLTENGKNYIATTFGFGTNKCYVGSGLSWSYLGTDNQSYNETGGTAQIVSRLIVTSLVQSITYNGQNYTYAALKAANDNTDLTVSDAQWIAQNDGDIEGEPQYCSTSAPPQIVTGDIDITFLVKVKINYIYTITTSIIPTNNNNNITTDIITGVTEMVVGTGDNK